MTTITMLYRPMLYRRRRNPCVLLLAASLVFSAVPAIAAAGSDSAITVYFTRHAEKTTTVQSLGDATMDYSTDASGDFFAVGPSTGNGSNLDELCGDDKCAEELNPLGLERAELLADWFTQRGITQKLDAVYSSHKLRTLQTVQPTADAAGLTVMQLPENGTELDPQGTTASECPTIESIVNSAPGSTLLIAGHSGTLYDIMGTGNDDCAGLGLDTSDNDRFPKDADGKVRDFGDVWKIVIRHGTARFGYRVNLDFKGLAVVNRAP